MGIAGKANINKKLVAIIGAIAAVALVLGIVFFANSRPLSDTAKEELYNQGTYLEGVKIFESDVSGMTMEEAREIVDKKLNSETEKVLIELKLKDEIIPVTAKEIKFNNTSEEVLKEAMLYGREGNMFSKMSMKSKAKKEGVNFGIEISTDEESLNTLVDAIAKTYSIPVKNGTVQYTPNGASKFTYVMEEQGLTIKTEGLAQKIKDAVESNSTEPVVVDYEVVEPTLRVSDIKANMVLRSSYTTNVGGTAGRKSNVSLAAQKINGKVVMPGETFDIEANLGARTAANGWYKAGEFVNGELVDGYGGGICQASTTLFNAVLRADLEIVNRSNHSQTVSYVPLGFDAAISKGGPLFVFKNNTQYPIVIVAYSSNNKSKVTVELYGQQLSYGSNVTYKEVSTVTATTAATTKEVKDSSLPTGKTQIVQKPVEGKKVTSTLIFYANGKEVHRRTWKSSYNKKNGEIRVGTGTTAKKPATTTAKPTTVKPTTAKPTTQATTAPAGN